MLKHWIAQYRENTLINRLLSVLSIDVLIRVSNILLLPVYLKLMSQEDYGLYNYILSIINTIALILTFGLYVSQSKYYSDNHGDTTRQKEVLFTIIILLSSLLIVVLVPTYLTGADSWLISLLFNTPVNYDLLRWPLLLAIVISVFNVFLSNFFITSEKIKTFRRYNVVRLILSNVIVLSVLFSFQGQPLYLRLTYTYITELIVLLIFSVYYIREMRPVLNKTIILNTFKLGFPIMASAILALFGNYSDKFFLEKKGGANDLSYYYLAFSISNIIYMVCMAAQNAWLPAFLKEKDIKLNIRRTNQLLKKLTLVLLLVSVAFIIGFRFAIYIKIIDYKYLPTIYILPVLLLAQLISGIILIYGNYLVYLEKTQWTLFIGVISAVIGVTGSYYMVPYGGTMGAGLTYLGVQAVSLYLYHLIIKSKLKKRLESI